MNSTVAHQSSWRSKLLHWRNAKTWQVGGLTEREVGRVVAEELRRQSELANASVKVVRTSKYYRDQSSPSVPSERGWRQELTEICARCGCTRNCVFHCMHRVAMQLRTAGSHTFAELHGHFKLAVAQRAGADDLGQVRVASRARDGWRFGMCDQRPSPASARTTHRQRTGHASGFQTHCLRRRHRARSRLPCSAWAFAYLGDGHDRSDDPKRECPPLGGLQSERYSRGSSSRLMKKKGMELN